MLDDDDGRPPTGWDHNRRPVPPSVRSAHFLYKAAAPTFDPADVAEVVTATKRMLEERGLYCAQIEVFGRRQFESCVPESVAAFDRLVAALPAICAGKSLSVLVCEWATPHVDDSYEGKAFYSAVLHTGNNAYVMQTLHSGRSQQQPNVSTLTTSARTLDVGEAIVFDPTTPHFAAPKWPHESQLLVLLQAELDDETDEDRAALLAALPPLLSDRDEASVFTLFG